MEGKIVRLGKNGCKNYFIIRGEDKNEYFAHISNVKNSQKNPGLLYPSIWAGAKILSFNVKPANKDGNMDNAVNIELDNKVSSDERYWEGRQDSLKEFAYWYEKTGAAQTPKAVSRYLEQNIGWSGNTERNQVVQFGAWRRTDTLPPKDEKTVLIQAYDMVENDIVYFTGYRDNNTWQIITPEGVSELPDNEYKVQATMDLPQEYREHRH